MVSYQLVHQFTLPAVAQEARGIGNSRLAQIESLLGTPVLFETLEVKVPVPLPEGSRSLPDIQAFFTVLEAAVASGCPLEDADIRYLAHEVHPETLSSLVSLFSTRAVLWVLQSGKKPVYPRSLNQRLYVQALKTHAVTFAIGPAGTGKTFLATLHAVSLLKSDAVRKIILVRPVVEAGESLGFLPGDLKEKVDPYLVPLYDVLNDALGKETVDKLIEKGIIEIAPLAYMRGRTLTHAAIILDEAQNTTVRQMKMFLTRLGEGSTMIITGDLTQVDLLKGTRSGLADAVSLFARDPDFGVIRFCDDDAMRHPLVTRMLHAYDESEKSS